MCVPVQRIVPAFSSVCELSVTAPGLLMFNVAPGAMIVRPLPARLPLGQFISFTTISRPPIEPPSQSHLSNTLKVPLPQIAGAWPGAPSVRLRHAASVLFVIFAAYGINTLSFEAGTSRGDQLARSCQFPASPDALHVIS